MRFILAGTALILRSPKLWRFVVQPLLTAALAFLAVSAAAYFVVVPRLNALVDHLAGSTRWERWVNAVDSLLFVGLLFLTSGFLYLTLASFFSAGLWEKLSCEVEFIQTGRRIETKLPVRAIITDGLARGSFAIAVTCLSFCCSWALFGVPAILFAGYLGLHDYTSSAYLRRGITFPSQMAEVRKLSRRGTFLLGAGLLTLIPVVNVLMLPCLVAGGTLMVVNSLADGSTIQS